MDLQIEGKRALVTGSSKGIGFAVAEILAAEGAEVFINGRDPDRLDEARKRMRDNTRVQAAAADLSSADGVAKLVSAVPEVDILVNNMGIFEPKPFQEITDTEWFTFFETNVMSGVRLSRRYLPGMKERGWGRVVFVSSESGIHIPEEMIHYGMTKAAQIAVARGLAETTAGTNVTVNSVLPGPTASEGVMTFVEQMAAEKGVSVDEMKSEFFRTARPTSLLRRFTEPKEVAWMVAYACSPLSSATNGAPLRADGGVVRAMT